MTSLFFTFQQSKDTLFNKEMPPKRSARSRSSTPAKGRKGSRRRSPSPLQRTHPEEPAPTAPAAVSTVANDTTTTLNPINCLIWGLSIGTNLVAILGGEHLPWHVKFFVKTSMCAAMALIALRARMRFIAIGFAFSFLGDVFLVTSFKHYLLEGMGSFIVGRLFMMAGFHRLRPEFLTLRRTVLHFLCAAGATAMLGWLLWYLLPQVTVEEMRIPLVAFGFIMWGNTVEAVVYGESALIPVGTLFYFMCDSLIALQAFASANPLWSEWWVDPLIWITYSIGLHGIALGCVVENDRNDLLDLMLQGDRDAKPIRKGIQHIKDKSDSLERHVGQRVAHIKQRVHTKVDKIKNAAQL